MAQIIPREAVTAFSRSEYLRHMKAVADAPIAGAMEAVLLLDKREFIFQGRSYRVPPVPWHLAAEVLDVRDRLRAKNVTAESRLAETRVQFARAARLSKRVCRPAGFVQRLLWLLPFYNPFYDATPWQVGRHLGFFSTCLVLDQAPQEVPAPLASGTSSPTSPPSRNGGQRGLTLHGGQGNGRAAQSPGLTS